MNVIHLNQHLAAKGGVETYLLEVLPKLEQQGVHSIWVYAEGDASLWRHSISFPALSKPKATHTDQRALKKHLEALNADVIHIHNIQNADLVETCFSICPTIITNHDYRWICPANNFFFKNDRTVCQKDCGNLGCFTTTLRKHCLTPRPAFALPFYRRIRQMKAGHSQLSHTIAPSPIAAERLIRAGWDQTKITVLPYFCPLEVRYAPRPIPAIPTISYVGRIAPNKGHLSFIRALGQLPSNWQGILAGDIDENVATHLMQEAIKYDCADRLQLKPWANRKEVLEIMDSSTVFIFPSLWEETLGIVALEALSRGVPVVSSNIVGVEHWLNTLKCGISVPPNDAMAIAGAVISLSASDESLIHAGTSGIQLIKDQFSPDVHTTKLLEIYQSALQDTRYNDSRST